MRTLSLIALLVLSFSALAQREGDSKDIDGQKFTYTKGTWVHDALGSSYSMSDSYATVYRDKKWQKWYSEGSPTLKKILDLGPNVVFKFKGADGAFHNYGSFRSKAMVKKAVAGGGAAVAAGLAGAGAAGAAAAGGGATILGMSATTAAIVGGAVVAGAVIVEANNDDDDDSPSN